MCHRLRSLALAAVTLAACSFCTLYAQQMTLVPTAAHGGYPQAFLDVCLNTSEWPTALQYTGALGTISDDIPQADDATLSACFANMRALGFQLTIEVQAFQPGGCGYGRDCYNNFAPQLARVIADGAPSIRLRLQEPLTDGREYNWPQDDIVNETVTFMALVQQSFPGIAVTSIEAYPYNSASLLEWWMPALYNACVAAGVQPPDKFELDQEVAYWNSPYTQYDIGVMTNSAHQLGWGFGIIMTSVFNPPPPSDVQYYSELLYRGQLYASYGIVPDTYIFESWDPGHPSAAVPETTPYTFTYNVAQFIGCGYFLYAPTLGCGS